MEDKYWRPNFTTVMPTLYLVDKKLILQVCKGSVTLLFLSSKYTNKNQFRLQIFPQTKRNKSTRYSNLTTCPYLCQILSSFVTIKHFLPVYAESVTCMTVFISSSPCLLHFYCLPTTIRKSTQTTKMYEKSKHLQKTKKSSHATESSNIYNVSIEIPEAILSFETNPLG